MAASVIADGARVNFPAVVIVFAQRVAVGDATEAECVFMKAALDAATSLGWCDAPMFNLMTPRFPQPVRCK